MRYSGTWLTLEDEALLEHLQAHGPAMPARLVERAELDFSEDYVAARCAQLAGRGRLVAFADGAYRLTDRGAAYLDGELDPAELSTD